MRIDNSLLKDYENRNLIKYDDANDNTVKWVAYDSLSDTDVA